MPEPNGATIQASLDAHERKRSVTKADYASGGVVHFMLPVYGAWGNPAAQVTLPERLPAYARYSFFTRRDVTLLSTPHHEAMWADALAIAITKAAAWGWEIESGVPLRRKRAQQVLLNSTAGIFTGWVPFISAHLRSFLTTGKAIVEIERETRAYSSRVVALHHLNPLRCQLTDNPKIPVLYYDREGHIHELKYWQVMLFGDLVDPTLGEYAIVQSAAERAYTHITTLAAISRYLYEKITGKRALSLEFIQGITAKHLEDAIVSADSERQRKGHQVYMGAAVIPIPGDVPVQRVSIPLAEIPDGFNAQEERDEGKIGYADAIGMDVNDLDPRLAQTRNLGSGAQSIVLAEKAKGKGLAGWRAQWEHNTNWWTLDTESTFAFSEQDLDDETKRANLKKTRGEWRHGMIQAGEITPAQSVNLAVDDGDLPREFLAEDVTAGDALGDDEKPVEQVGAAVQGTPPPVVGVGDAANGTIAQAQTAVEKALKHLAGKHDQMTHGRGGGVLGSPQEAEKYFGEKESAWRGSLSDDEKESIRKYTLADYERINEELRNGECCSTRDIDKNVEHLDSALSRNKLQEGLTLYRGVEYGDLHSKISNGEVEVGDWIDDLGYMSTSPAKNTALNFGTQIVFEIEAPAGTRGAYVTPFSAYDEMEFLFARETSMRINSIDWDGDTVVLNVSAEQ